MIPYINKCLDIIFIINCIIQKFFFRLKNPEERYQSAAQLRQALEKVSKAPYGYCPECGKKLLKKNGPYGNFLGCSGFRKNKPGACDFHSGIDKFLNHLNESRQG